MAKKETTNQTENASSVSDEVKKIFTPIRRISVKNVCGVVKAKMIGAGEELKLMRVAGYASGTSEGSTQFGEWHSIEGDFSAINFTTGEYFLAASCFVPGAMGDALIDAVKKQISENNVCSLRFCVDVSCVLSPRDDSKIEYVVRPVIENEISNRSVALLSM